MMVSVRFGTFSTATKPNIVLQFFHISKVKRIQVEANCIDSEHFQPDKFSMVPKAGESVQVSPILKEL